MCPDAIAPNDRSAPEAFLSPIEAVAFEFEAVCKHFHPNVFLLQ
jgi:hypothetical protein